MENCQNGSRTSKSSVGEHRSWNSDHFRACWPGKKGGEEFEGFFGHGGISKQRGGQKLMSEDQEHALIDEIRNQVFPDLDINEILNGRMNPGI